MRLAHSTQDKRELKSINNYRKLRALQDEDEAETEEYTDSEGRTVIVTTYEDFAFW